MIIHAKIKRKTNDQPSGCVYCNTCPSAREWCNTHNYGAECVPNLQLAIVASNAEIVRQKSRAVSLQRENELLREMKSKKVGWFF